MAAPSIPSPAPPPTRGSSSCEASAERKPRGSPAHAGIVPPDQATAGPRSRLPRPRGDRPPRTGLGFAGVAAPPPTRDRPAPAAVLPDLAWAPPPHGDRPFADIDAAAWPTAPPPTRGSSPGRTTGRARRPGSPAHAGIVRNGFRSHSLLSRLPRRRGDRPASATAAKVGGAAPPPTRGSSLDDPALGDLRDGSPRPRGDHPDFDDKRSRVWGALPPTRASSLAPREVERRRHCSPAHAGISRHPIKAKVTNQAPPPTCGDRPAPR